MYSDNGDRFVMFLCVCKMLWCDFVNPWGKPTPAVWWDALCGLWPNFSLLELEICIFVLSFFVFVYFYVRICVFNCNCICVVDVLMWDIERGQCAKTVSRVWSQSSSLFVCVRLWIYLCEFVICLYLCKIVYVYLFCLWDIEGSPHQLCDELLSAVWTNFSTVDGNSSHS